METKDFSNAIDVIAARAKITLLSTEEGGRRTAIGTGYRPNHVFEYRDDGSFATFIGEIQFENMEEIKPGEEGDVIVYFLKMPAIIPFLTTGRKWWLHEGQRLVGVGEIYSIVVG